MCYFPLDLARAVNAAQIIFDKHLTGYQHVEQ